MSTLAVSMYSSGISRLSLSLKDFLHQKYRQIPMQMTMVTISNINKANMRYGLVIQDSEKHEKVQCQTIDIEYEVYVLVINKYYI